MNKYENRMKGSSRFVTACAVLISLAVSGMANAQVDYVLMVQQTPVDGGVVSPDIGVHNVSANGAVTVTATPKPGYQFVYWLGDVADSTSTSTVVSIDTPKIVVAVFQRSEFDQPFNVPAPSEGAGGGGGGGALMFHNPMSAPGEASPAQGSSSGGRRFSHAQYITPQPNSVPNDPSNGNPPPVITPEPATMLLLGIGAVMALRRKK